VIYKNIVCYKHEISLLKYAEPNQVIVIVRYNREFVIAVIVITDLGCTFWQFYIQMHKNQNLKKTKMLM